MPLFRRRPREPAADGDAGPGAADAADRAPGGNDLQPGDPAMSGPVDAAELDEAQRTDRLDLGALLIATVEGALDGLEVQLQADEASGEVLAVLVLQSDDAAVELRAFAASKRTGLWNEVRREIAEGAAAAGGQSADALGAWGIELLVQVPVTLPDGQPAVQVSRIAGIDGPRWLLRATFLGRAAVEPETAGRLQAVVEGLAVVRGDGPMAPRDPLPLVIPGQQPGMALPDAPGDGQPPPLRPFERGPEITETR